MVGGNGPGPGYRPVACGQELVEVDESNRDGLATEAVRWTLEVSCFGA